MVYRIGEVAKICSISSETLRHYDRIGLLVPSKKPGSLYRHYTDSQIELVFTIQHLSNLGITLGSIKNLINTTDLKSFNAVLHNQKKVIEKQLEELETMKAGISSLAQSVDQCMNGQESITIKKCPKLYFVMFSRDDESYVQLVDVIEKLPDEWLRTTEYMYTLNRELLLEGAQDSSTYGLVSEYPCASEHIGIKEIPSSLCATFVFFGKENNIGMKCTELSEWVVNAGYAIASDTIVFIKANLAESQEENIHLIEIWIPVKKELTL